MSLAQFRERCTAAALTAQADRDWLLNRWTNYPHYCQEQSVQFQLIELQEELLAALYGCKPELIPESALVTQAGDIQPGAIDAPGSSSGHQMCQNWQDSSLESLTLGYLNLELRGLSRAIWLALLWSGGAVRPFERRWYNAGDLVQYWPVAWSLTYGCPEEHKDDKRFQLIAYAFAVSAEYTRRHPKNRTHKAAAYFMAAAQQWGLYD